MAKPVERKNLLVDLGLVYKPGYMEGVANAVKPDEYLFKKLAAKSNEYGKGVEAREAIKEGELLLRFRGEIKTFEEFPFCEKSYLIPVGNFLWINPVGVPRYVNHSCDPNCEIRNKVDLYAIRAIKAGEELSFRYDVVSGDIASSPASFIDECRWDHAFTFTCLCGAPACVGVVDRNRIFNKIKDKTQRKSVKKKAEIVA